MQTRLQIFPAMNEKHIFIAKILLDKDVLRRLYIDIYPMGSFLRVAF